MSRGAVGRWLIGALVFFVITLFEQVPILGWQLGNLLGPDTAGGARVGAAFGTVGSSLGVLLWPLFGAMVCALAAAVRREGQATRRRFPET